MKVEKPAKMDKLTVQKLEEAFSMDCGVGEACLLANITKQTYYNWIESFPEMKERFDLLRENPVLLARTTVNRAIQENPNIAFTYLERKRRSEFSPSQKVEHTGNIGFSLNITADDEQNTMEADEQTSNSVEIPN